MDAPQSSSPQIFPTLWEIDPNTNKPTNPQLFSTTIRDLTDHPSLLEDNANIENVTKLFERLEITDFSEQADTLSDCQKLFSIEGKLFPSTSPEEKETMIMLKSGEVEVFIPKNLLAAQSDKFKKMFSSHWAKANKLDLAEPNIHSDTFKSFAHFLKTGDIQLTGDNILPLLHLADEHGVPKLEKTCIEFLKENMDTNLFEPLQSFIENRPPEDNLKYTLSWLLMEHASGIEPKGQEYGELKAKYPDIFSKTHSLQAVGIKLSVDSGLRHGPVHRHR